MAKVKMLGSYVRDVPDTWEQHSEFHAYMKMYEGLSVEESIAYAKQYLGPAPAKVTVNKVEIVPDDDDNE